MGTPFVDSSMRIRKFTDAALRLLNAMPQDIGRPLDHIAAKIPGVDLVAMCRRVMNAQAPESHDMLAPDGSHLHVKVLPYLTGETGMHGVIVSVIDVTEVKRGEERLQHILDSIPSSLAVLGPDGTIVQTNAEWTRFAQANDAPPALVSGIGLNYVATCMAATDDVMAHAVGRGLREVLAGKRERFELQYPCHSPDKRRYFLLQATALTHTVPRTRCHAAPSCSTSTFRRRRCDWNGSQRGPNRCRRSTCLSYPRSPTTDGQRGLCPIGKENAAYDE